MNMSLPQGRLWAGTCLQTVWILCPMCRHWQLQSSLFMMILYTVPFLAPLLYCFQPKSILKGYTEFWLFKIPLGIIALKWLNYHSDNHRKVSLASSGTWKLFFFLFCSTEVLRKWSASHMDRDVCLTSILMWFVCWKSRILHKRAAVGCVLIDII